MREYRDLAYLHNHCVVLPLLTVKGHPFGLHHPGRLPDAEQLLVVEEGEGEVLVQARSDRLHHHQVPLHLIIFCHPGGVLVLGEVKPAVSGLFHGDDNTCQGVKTTIACLHLQLIPAKSQQLKLVIIVTTKRILG